MSRLNFVNQKSENISRWMGLVLFFFCNQSKLFLFLFQRSGDFRRLWVRVEETEMQLEAAAAPCVCNGGAERNSSAPWTAEHWSKRRRTETVSCYVFACCVSLIRRNSGCHEVGGLFCSLAACPDFTTWVKGSKPHTDGVRGVIQWL